MWLISKGRVDEAEKILVRAAKFNNKSLPRNPLSGKTHYFRFLFSERSEEYEAETCSPLNKSRDKDCSEGPWFLSSLMWNECLFHAVLNFAAKF